MGRSRIIEAFCIPALMLGDGTEFWQGDFPLSRKAQLSWELTNFRAPPLEPWLHGEPPWEDWRVRPCGTLLGHAPKGWTLPRAHRQKPPSPPFLWCSSAQGRWLRDLIPLA